MFLLIITFSRHIIIKLLKSNKEKILNAAREKRYFTERQRITAEFSSETMYVNKICNFFSLCFILFLIRDYAMAPHSSTLAWKIPWMEEPVGCCPWGCEESDTTERLHFHFSLSCIGEGNGNPLQCSCLENPRDGGAWWAAVYRVTHSRR